MIFRTSQGGICIHPLEGILICPHLLLPGEKSIDSLPWKMMIAGLFHDEWMGRCDISYWKFGGSFQLVILVSGWWFQIFLIFTPTWGRFPFWLIFVKWVETTNQYQFSGAYWCHCETPKKSSIHVAPGPWKSHIPTRIPAALPRDEMRQQVRSEKVELYKERGFQCGSEKTITRWWF